MRLATFLHHRFHDARARLFIEAMRPQPGSSLLDLGGNDGSLAERITKHVPMRVVVADMETSKRPFVEARGFEFVALTGEGPLPFADQSFDYVLCNSVIEHVTLPKERCATERIADRAWRRESAEAQRAFAREIRRVGQHYFVQTPDRRFPVCQHSHLPLVHWLPHNALARLIAVTDQFWLKHCGYVDWHLLTPRVMHTLFPDARIHVERVLGLPKSVVAYH